MTIKTENVVTKWDMDARGMRNVLIEIGQKLEGVQGSFRKTETATIAFATAAGNVAVAAIGALKNAMSGLIKTGLDTEDWLGKDIKAIEGMKRATGGMIGNLELIKARTQLMNGDLQLTEEQLQAVTKAAIHYTRVNKTDFPQSLEIVTRAIQSGSARSIKQLGIYVDETGDSMTKAVKITEAITNRFSGMSIEAVNTNERISILTSTFTNLVGSIGNAILSSETFTAAMKNVSFIAREIDDWVSKSALRKEFESVSLRIREINEEMAVATTPGSGGMFNVGRYRATTGLPQELARLKQEQARLREELKKSGEGGAFGTPAAKGPQEIVFGINEGTTISRSKATKNTMPAGRAWNEFPDVIDEGQRIAKLKEENERYIQSQYDLADAEFALNMKREAGLKIMAKQIAAQKEQSAIVQSFVSGALTAATNAWFEHAGAMLFAGESAGDAALGITKALMGALGQEAQAQAAKQLALALGTTFTNPAESGTHWGSYAAWQTLAGLTRVLSSGMSSSRSQGSSSGASVAQPSGGVRASAPSGASKEEKETIINVYFGQPDSPVANLIATKNITRLQN